MLDMGFIPDVRKIVALLPAAARRCCSRRRSRTTIRRLAREFQHDPEIVEVAPRNSDRRQPDPGPLPGRHEPQGRPADPPDPARRAWSRCSSSHAARSGRAGWRRTWTAEASARSAIHGDRSQAERTRALEAFSGRYVKVLVATDVASRGSRHRGPAATSSTSSCRSSRRTTSTASAEPAGPAPAGRPSRSFRPTRSRALRAIQRLLRKSIPCQVVEEYLPDPDREPAPTVPAVVAGRTRGIAQWSQPRNAPATSAGGPNSPQPGVADRMRKRKVTYPVAHTATKQPRTLGLPGDPGYVRSTVATINLAALDVRDDLKVGHRVRIGGAGCMPASSRWSSRC